MISIHNMRKEKPNKVGDVRIDRGSIWGNIFKIGPDGDRRDVIEHYRIYIEDHPELVQKLRDTKPERLFCWCKPLACHGDVLKELLDEPT